MTKTDLSAGRAGKTRFTRLKNLAARVKDKPALYRLVLKHPRTPRTAKILLGLAIFYLVNPFELIPDFIPVIGYLDDVIIVSVLVIAARMIIPAEVMDECRRKLQHRRSGCDKGVAI